VNGGGNEATQLLRKMINCRSLGLPFTSAISISGALGDQPISLIKVREQKSIFFFFKNVTLKLLSFRMTIITTQTDHRKQQAAENSRVRVEHLLTVPKIIIQSNEKMTTT
jgi:hypothetical protein